MQSPPAILRQKTLVEPEIGDIVGGNRKNFVCIAGRMLAEEAWEVLFGSQVVTAAFI
jgi:hypothetical protein